MLTRDGDREGREGGERVKARPGRPMRPWPAARTTEVLRRCPLRHCAATSVLRDCCFSFRAVCAAFSLRRKESSIEMCCIVHVLHYTVLCCIVLHRNVLYCTLLHFIASYLYCIVLHIIAWYCTVLHCIVLYYIL